MRELCTRLLREGDVDEVVELGEHDSSLIALQRKYLRPIRRMHGVGTPLSSYVLPLELIRDGLWLHCDGAMLVHQKPGTDWVHGAAAFLAVSRMPLRRRCASALRSRPSAHLKTAQTSRYGMSSTATPSGLCAGLRPGNTICCSRATLPISRSKAAVSTLRARRCGGRSLPVEKLAASSAQWRERPLPVHPQLLPEVDACVAAQYAGIDLERMDERAW